MRIFQSIRKYLAILGIEPLQPFQKKRLMTKRLVVFIIFILFFTSSLVFIGYEASSLGEYADAFYMSATLDWMIFAFGILLWKMDDIFKLIGDFEKLIQQRKSIKNYIALIIFIYDWKWWIPLKSNQKMSLFIQSGTEYFCLQTLKVVLFTEYYFALFLSFTLTWLYGASILFLNYS